MKKSRISKKLFNDEGLFRFSITSKVGELFCLGSDLGLRAILWEKDLVGDIGKTYFALPTKKNKLFKETSKEIEFFLLKQKTSFDLKFDLVGTAFQKKVWAGLQKTKAGDTLSYKELAAKVATPQHARAVGNANNKNPISLLIPCHRVIANDGGLAGYAGGLKTKELLLSIESL